jgi:hypothetical protein
MKKVLVLVMILIMFPLISFPALESDNPETGYELYQDLKGMDNPKSDKEVVKAGIALGYLKGFLDGIQLMSDAHYDTLFPSKMMTESERAEYAKKLNFHRLNIPKEGIAIGQFFSSLRSMQRRTPES